MALDKARLRDHIIYLEASDARRLRMNAREYQTTAREVARVVRCELGDLPMQAFANETLTALETTAQNVFFDGHGRFADLDGSGNALRAQAIGHLLFARLRRR